MKKLFTVKLPQNYILPYAFHQDFEGTMKHFLPELYNWGKDADDNFPLKERMLGYYGGLSGWLFGRNIFPYFEGLLYFEVNNKLITIYFNNKVYDNLPDNRKVLDYKEVKEITKKVLDKMKNFTNLEYKE
jgi:hypothetical protein